MSEIKNMLTVLVGSKAHGLDNAHSDEDFHSVFTQPTSERLRIGGDIVDATWTEGLEDNISKKTDDTGWELGRFLFLATKSNPTVLECFLAPVETATEDGMRLRELFPYIWDSKLVRDAFIGYGLNQRKKYLDNKDKRRPKFAAAYLRSLYNGWELLLRGTFTERIVDTPIGETVRRFKNGEADPGEVIATCLEWEQHVNDACDQTPRHCVDLEPVNAFLLDVRKREW